MQQDAENDEQDTDDEFPESDEMNQTGFSGEKTKYPRSISIYGGNVAEWSGPRTWH